MTRGMTTRKWKWTASWKGRKAATAPEHREESGTSDLEPEDTRSTVGLSTSLPLRLPSANLSFSSFESIHSVTPAAAPHATFVSSWPLPPTSTDIKSSTESLTTRKKGVARLQSPRTGGPLRPFGGKPAVSTVDEFLGFAAPTDITTSGYLDARRLTTVHPIRSRTSVVSSFNTPSEAGSSTGSLVDGSPKPPSAQSTDTTAPTSTASSSPRQSRTSGDLPSRSVPSLSLHLSKDVQAFHQFHLRSSTSTNSINSKSLRRAFGRKSSNPPPSFEPSAPPSRPSRAPNLSRTASVSSIWSKVTSISRKSSVSDSLKLVKSSAPPSTDMEWRTFMIDNTLPPVPAVPAEARAHDQSSLGSSSSRRLSPVVERRSSDSEYAGDPVKVLTFYEAAALDRLYPRINKALPVLPPSPRPPPLDFTLQGTLRPPSSEPLQPGSSLSPTPTVSPVTFTRKLNRRSWVSIKDFPPPPPPPTGPLPPTPSTAPLRLDRTSVRFSREIQIEDDGDSLADLNLASEKFYSLGDDQGEPSPPARTWPILHE